VVPDAKSLQPVVLAAAVCEASSINLGGWGLQTTKRAHIAYLTHCGVFKLAVGDGDRTRKGRRVIGAENVWDWDVSILLNGQMESSLGRQWHDYSRGQSSPSKTKPDGSLASHASLQQKGIEQAESGRRRRLLRQSGGCPIGEECEAVNGRIGGTDCGLGTMRLGRRDRPSPRLPCQGPQDGALVWLLGMRSVPDWPAAHGSFSMGKWEQVGVVPRLGGQPRHQGRSRAGPSDKSSALRDAGGNRTATLTHSRPSTCITVAHMAPKEKATRE
jgi:hypothetical protein